MQIQPKQIVGFMPVYAHVQDYYLETYTRSGIASGVNEVLSAQWLSTLFDAFPETSGSDLQDKNILVDYDLQFALNHIYDAGEFDPPVWQHLSLSANVKARAIIMLDGTGLGEMWHTFNILEQSGYWIKYSYPFYSGVTSYGQLDMVSSDPNPIIVQLKPSGQFAPPGTPPSLMIINNLKDYAGFLNEPDYNLSVKIKIQAREFSLDDHTYEIPK